MQTFLPYADFTRSAKSIDDGKRLNKQCLEAVQILKSNLGIKIVYPYHPITIMWRGYEGSLFRLALVYCLVWKESKNNKKQENKNLKELFKIKKYCERKNIKLNEEMPWWWGNKKFHDSHKSNLLFKKPSHYNKFNWKVPDNLPYFFPVTSRKKQLVYNLPLPTNHSN